MLEVRSFGMPCNLCLLPRSQFGICVFKLLVRLVAQLGDLGADINFAFIRRLLQFKYAGFQSCHGLFEIEIYGHESGLEPRAITVNAPSSSSPTDDAC